MVSAYISLKIAVSSDICLLVFLFWVLWPLFMLSHLTFVLGFKTKQTDIKKKMENEYIKVSISWFSYENDKQLEIIYGTLSKLDIIFLSLPRIQLSSRGL